MRKVHLTVMALAALVTFVAGLSAITAQPRRAPATVPLYPLSERDLSATRESGCECGFRVGRRNLVQLIGNELTVRTGGGRRTCRIGDEQFAALSDGTGNATCGGVRLNLRRTGRVRSMMESDSADWPASLTVSQGRMRRTIAGRGGCAC